MFSLQYNINNNYYASIPNFLGSAWSCFLFDTLWKIYFQSNSSILKEASDTIQITVQLFLFLATSIHIVIKFLSELDRLLTDNSNKKVHPE